MSLLTDREHLPNKVVAVDGIRDVLDAISPEIESIKAKIKQTLKELFVETTENCIDNWEKDYSIKFDTVLTLEQRRANVLNKIRNKNVLTWDNLDLLIKSNIENVPFYVINNSSLYTFKVCVATSDYSQLEKALKRAKPAYITFTIEVVDVYVRHCGTFECGTEPL